MIEGLVINTNRDRWIEAKRKASRFSPFIFPFPSDSYPIKRVVNRFLSEWWRVTDSTCERRFESARYSRYDFIAFVELGFQAFLSIAVGFLGLLIEISRW